MLCTIGSRIHSHIAPPSIPFATSSPLPPSPPGAEKWQFCISLCVYIDANRIAVRRYGLAARYAPTSQLYPPAPVAVQRIRRGVMCNDDVRKRARGVQGICGVLFPTTGGREHVTFGNQPGPPSTFTPRPTRLCRTRSRGNVLH